MKLFTSESAHWYTRDGRAMHTVTGLNGEPRATTLRDARKLGLLPSVTSITGIIQKEGIAQWKMQHCVESALTLPRNPGEELGDFALRVAADAESAMRVASDFGTEFHAGAQRVADNPLGLSPKEELYEWLVAYRDWLETNVERVVWTERVLLNNSQGYAGTADLLVVHRKRGLTLVDIKTQGVPEKKLPRIYPGWLYQLAAYRRILGPDVGCMNLVVNSKRPVVEGEHHWTPEELTEGWEVFQAARLIWMHEKDYRPVGAGNLPCSSEQTTEERSTPNGVETCR